MKDHLPARSITLITLSKEELLQFADEVADRAIMRYKQQLEDEQELDTDQAAEYCRVSPNTIRRWVNDEGNPLPRQMKNGRRYTVKKKDLNKRLHRD